MKKHNMSNKIIKKINLSVTLSTNCTATSYKKNFGQPGGIADCDEAIKIHNPNSPFPFSGIFNTVKIINVSPKAKY